MAGNPQKDAVLRAAQKLEDASHALAERGEPLPGIMQMVVVPQNAVPGQTCKVQNPQMPGTYMNLQVPPNAQPGQPISAPLPIQPGQRKPMATGSKVMFAAGGAVVAGGMAYGAYHLASEGHLDGVAGAIGGADYGGMAGDAGGALSGAADAVAGADYGGMAA